MRRVFVDASVLLFGFGGAHPWRDRAHALVAAAHAGDLQLHLSVEALQEFLFHRMRRSARDDALADLAAAQSACVVHPFDEAVWRQACDLVRDSPIRGRDAVHAATALRHGFGTIVTGDADFAAVPGLTPVEPGDVRL